MLSFIFTIIELKKEIINLVSTIKEEILTRVKLIARMSSRQNQILFTLYQGIIMLFKKSTIALAVVVTLIPIVYATSQDSISKVPKEASQYTIQKNNDLKAYLNFENTSDFQDAARGLVAQWPEKQIKNAQGKIVWDFSKYDFIDNSPNIDSINPSLLRQAKLNNLHGLFKVKDGLYQVRGFDLSVMTFIRSNKGWIVIDPLISAEPAAAGLKLLQDKVENKPVVAVIFTHSHIDHFGGVFGVTSQADIDSGKVEVIAPEGFFENAISENIVNGNIMGRRSTYMYGSLVAAGSKGQVDGGLGKTTSSGNLGITNPPKLYP